MPLRKYNFVDPKFNEWLFDFLSNLTAEQKGVLNNYECSLVRGHRMKSFVAEGNLEKKLTILTKLGIEWHLLFTKGEFDYKMIKEVYRQYTMKGKRLAEITNLVKSGAFVLSSKDVAISLAMMNQNCHSDAFTINKNYLKMHQAYHTLLANISASLGKHNLMIQAKDTSNAMQIMNKVIYEALFCEDFLAFNLKLAPLHVAILSVLFQDPNNYFKLDTIKQRVRAKYKPLSVGIHCTELWKERGMIDRMPSNEKQPSYKIMQGGILALGELFNRIVNNAAN